MPNPMPSLTQPTTLDLGVWNVCSDSVRQYLSAVGDELPVYQNTGFAPPLWLAARIVGVLLERLSLPDGTIHSLQDVEALEPIGLGSRVAATATVEAVRQRGGMSFQTITYVAKHPDSDMIVLRGRTTVLLPAGEVADGDQSHES